MKFRFLPASLCAASTFLAFPLVQAQDAAAPSGGPTATSTPTAAPAPGALPPVEELAAEAQRQLFRDADRATAGAGAGGTRRTATFSSPRADDPSLWKKESQHKLAVMDVSFGGKTETVIMELYPADAPKTVANFIDNVESGSYKGLAFHRAVQGFLVQTGDPLTADESARDRWGTGGESKSVPAEIKRMHRKGSVAMGRRSDSVNPGRRSNGYQFYFALGNFAPLDGHYTVFGQVVSGLDVIERISKLPVDSNDCPIARIEIKSMKVIDHTGPLAPTVQDNSDGRKNTKPYAAKNFFERVLEHVW